MTKLTNSLIKAASGRTIRITPLILTLSIAGCANGSNGKLPSTGGYNDPLRGKQHAYNVSQYFRSAE